MPKTESTSFSPPLALSWRSGTALTKAVVGDNILYGTTSGGRIVALNGTDGSQKWATTLTYLSNRLARQGTRLFAYQSGQGLAFIDDQGTKAAERLVTSFAASDSANLSTPVIDGRLVFCVVNQGLYAIHQDQGLLFGTILSSTPPHTVGLVSPGEIVTIDGAGIPTRYHVGATSFQKLWDGAPHGVDNGLSERPFIVAGNHLVIGVGSDTVAYDLATGSIAWHLSNVPANAFTASGDNLYAAFHGAALWAIRISDGTTLWQRQYIYDISVQREYGLAVVGDYLYFGGALQKNPDGAILLAVRTSDGSFAWLSRSAVGSWSAGIPQTDGNKLFVYGAAHTGAYAALVTGPSVGVDAITVDPRPLRGPAAGFGTGKVSVNLPVAARVTIAAYRELQGLGSLVVNNASWQAGTHEASWSPNTSGGFTDKNQFGYILVDVAENGGPSYTRALLVPVNTFPDILWHWAETNIEIMAFNKFVNGYLDQTFRPNDLVSRAESSTIIAKTLNVEKPSAGFQTKFTDIATHWARNYIMALEERGIVGGFQEEDGTLTFRPNLQMTRAQEARILVRAYAIPPVPPGFATKFTDIAQHWAAEDIKALEAAGYVNGFREADGTYTYRPEQNLTRAELCTVVVRIRKLTR